MDEESIKQRIKELEEEIRRTPYNKSTAFHIGKLKRAIKKLRQELMMRSSKKSAHLSYAVKKEGHATVVMVGFPSVGKSTLLNKLTNAESRVGAYDFTTLTIIPGMMEHDGFKIQVLDLPGIIEDASQGRGLGKQVLSVVRNAELILLVLSAEKLEQLSVIKKELFNTGVRLDQQPPRIKVIKKDRGGVSVEAVPGVNKEFVESVAREHKVLNADIIISERVSEQQVRDAFNPRVYYAQSITVINKTDLLESVELEKLRKEYKDAVFVSAERNQGLTELKKAIIKKLHLIKVYTKPVGKKVSKEPLIMKQPVTVKKVCEKVHKNMVKNFRYARVWGSSAKFPGQKVGLNHKLHDKDVIQIHA